MEPRCFVGVIGDSLPSIINLSEEHEILSENVSHGERYVLHIELGDTL